jgi:proteasome assembly chaperone (PAC2) family protein
LGARPPAQILFSNIFVGKSIDPVVAERAVPSSVDMAELEAQRDKFRKKAEHLEKIIAERKRQEAARVSQGEQLARSASARRRVYM